MSLNRLKKRFNFEIDNLNSIENIFVEECQDYDGGLDIYYFTNKYTLNIKLLFTRSYPFTPPTVNLLSVEETDYIEFLCNVSCNFESLDDNVCLCCSTIICKDKWGPQIKLSEIAREIIKITKHCDNQINKNIRKSIYLKYLGYSII